MASRLGIRLVVLALGSGASAAASAACVPSDTVLCLEDSRFAAEVTWNDSVGGSGSGSTLVYNDSTGLFTFFDERYVEMYVKVLDGCPVNGHFWVFAGVATDLGFTLTVTDTATAVTKQYIQLLGEPQAITDISAFDTCSAFPVGSSGMGSSRLAAGISGRGRELARPWLGERGATGPWALAPCLPGETTLCLVGSRFSVNVTWEDFTGNVGDGRSVSLTSHSGGFWFFSPDDLLMIVKIVEDCFFEVHTGGTTSVAFVLTVTDKETGAQVTLENPLGTTFGYLADRESFPNYSLPPLELEDLVIFDTRVYDDCWILTGPGFVIGITGDVTLRAPLVILREDTTIDSGGRLTVDTTH